jgi:2-C-methyl-D-erythritol 2,4-cyclodiphosphate synthase
VNFRIGSGYDVHRLVENRALWIGGIQIPNNKGALGTSDGDVLIHALCDAILGALNLGDLGKIFPSDDPKNKGISSLLILKQIVEMMRKENASIVNIDCTVILEEPKLSGYIPKIKEKLSHNLNCTEDLVSIKSKSNDGLGYIGQGDGIASICTVLLKIE